MQPGGVEISIDFDAVGVSELNVAFDVGTDPADVVNIAAVAAIVGENAVTNEDKDIVTVPDFTDNGFENLMFHIGECKI